LFSLASYCYAPALLCVGPGVQLVPLHVVELPIIYNKMDPLWDFSRSQVDKGKPAVDDNNLPVGFGFVKGGGKQLDRKGKSEEYSWADKPWADPAWSGAGINKGGADDYKGKVNRGKGKSAGNDVKGCYKSEDVHGTKGAHRNKQSADDKGKGTQAAWEDNAGNVAAKGKRADGKCEKCNKELDHPNNSMDSMSFCGACQAWRRDKDARDSASSLGKGDTGKGGKKSAGSDGRCHPSFHLVPSHMIYGDASAGGKYAYGNAGNKGKSKAAVEGETWKGNANKEAIEKGKSGKRSFPYEFEQGLSLHTSLVTLLT
jgi:hypothetical protein